MATGDVTNPKRTRMQANERLDTVDVEGLANAPRSLLDAYARAVEATPRNVGSSTPTGLILQGFGLTLNPTGPSDNKVRVQSPAGVAFDANGRMLIKENGVTTDLTLSAGNNQIYAYFVEDSTDTTVRRQISVTSPYAESGVAIPVNLKADVAYWVRTGDQTSIVSNDVVNGATTALCFLGVAVNTAGAVTMTGYDTVNAPNGAFVTNRISAVAAPTTPPPANTANGSLFTILDVLTAALYTVGQSAWKGSAFVTPSAANDFGAYKIPAGGVDKAYRQALGYVTIGDGSTIFGDFNTADYSDNNAMLVAALASLPTAGGRIYIKPGVSLSGFAGAKVSLPASKTVEIIGDHSSLPTTTPHLTFASGEGLNASATGKLILSNLHIRHSVPAIYLQAGAFKVRETYFENTSTTNTGAAIVDGVAATAIDGVDMDGVTISTVLAAIAAGAAGAMLVRITASIPIRNFKAANITYNNGAHEAGLLALQTVTNNIEIGPLTVNQSFATGGLTSDSTLITIGATDNATNIQDRRIHDVTVVNSAGSAAKIIMLDPSTCGYLNVDRLFHSASACVAGINASSGLTGPLTLSQCRFAQPGFTAVQAVGVVGDITMVQCEFANGALCNIGDGSGTVGSIRWTKCKFSGSLTATDQGHNVFGTTVARAVVDDCVIDSINDVNAQGWSVFTIAASAAVVEARFTNNTISNFQNVAYVGADATSTPFFFSVSAPEVNTTICSDNTVYSCMVVTDGSSGNARRAPYMLQLTGNTPGVSAFGDIYFQRNKSSSGPTTFFNNCQAYSITNFLAIINLITTDNEFSTSYSIAANPRTNDVYSLNNGAAVQSTIDLLRWSGNGITIWTGDTNPTSMAIDILRLACGTSFGGIKRLFLTSNSLEVLHAAGAFNGTTRHGISIDNYAIYATIISANTALRLTSNAISNFWQCEINTTSQVYNVNGNSGALPGSGSPFSNCVNFVQA